MGHLPPVPLSPLAGEDFVRLMLWSRNRTGVMHAVVSHASAV
jgi:hypothetical protein